MFSVHPCGHAFHFDCLLGWIRTKVMSNDFPIKCMANCGTELGIGDITQVLAGEHELFEEFQKRQFEFALKKVPGITYCSTPNCTGVVKMEPGAKTTTCEICKQ